MPIDFRSLPDQPKNLDELPIVHDTTQTENTFNSFGLDLLDIIKQAGKQTFTDIFAPLKIPFTDKSIPQTLRSISGLEEGDEPRLRPTSFFDQLSNLGPGFMSGFTGLSQEDPKVLSETTVRTIADLLSISPAEAAIFGQGKLVTQGGKVIQESTNIIGFIEALPKLLEKIPVGKTSFGRLITREFSGQNFLDELAAAIRGESAAIPKGTATNAAKTIRTKLREGDKRIFDEELAKRVRGEKPIRTEKTLPEETSLTPLERTQRKSPIKFEELPDQPTGIGFKGLTNELVEQVKSSSLDELGVFFLSKPGVVGTTALQKQINAVTGVTPPKEKPVIKETQALRRSLLKQAQAARKATVTTRQELTELKRDIVQFAKDTLPLSQQGKVITAVANANTPAAVEIAMQQITGIQQRLEQKTAITEFKDQVKDIDVKTLRPEFKKIIEPILKGIDPIKRTEKKLSSLLKMAEFIERQPENLIPKDKLDELKLFDQRNIEEMTKEEIRQVTDTIKHLTKLNDLKDKLILRGKLREAKEVVAKSIKNVEARNETKEGSLSGLDSFQQEKEVGVIKKIFGVDSYNSELRTNILDGTMEGDIISEVLYEGIDTGVSKQMAFEQQAEDFLLKELKGIDVTKWSRAFQKPKKVDKVKIKISGNRTLTMSKGERIAFLLHAKNPKNLRHLVEGGFSFVDTPAKIIKLSSDDIVAIQKSSTEEELKVANSINKYLNTIQKDGINKVAVELNGHEIATEPEYFPIRTSFLDRQREELLKVGNFSRLTLEGLGIFKKRKKSSNAIILEDAFTALYKNVKQVASYVGLAKPLRNAKMLLNNNKFQISLRNNGMAHYTEALKKYLDRIEGDPVRLDNIDKLTTNLINKLDVSILGINPWVIAKQPVSYLLAGTEMPIKYLRQISATKVTDQDIAEIKKWHPQLRDRFKGNVTRELGEISEVGAAKRFFTGKEAISGKIMGGIKRADLEAVARIWKAVKLEVKANQPELSGDNFMRAVADRAWKVIRRTQPTFHVKDRSTIGMSRNTFIRLLTKYSSQRNKNYMMYRRSFEKYNQSKKTPKDKANLAGSISLLALITPMMIMGIDELRNITYSRGEKKSLFRRAVDLLSVNLGNIYFLGTGFNSLVSKIEKGTFAGYDVNDPLTSTIDNIIGSIAEGVRSITQAVEGEKYKSGQKRGELKWKTSLQRFATTALDTFGDLKALPIRNIRKLLQAGVKQTAKGLEAFLKGIG